MDTLDNEVLKIGDAVKIVPGSQYVSGGNVPESIIQSKLYIRAIRENGDYSVALKQTGPIAGTVSPAAIVPYDSNLSEFETYVIIVVNDMVKIHRGPSSKSQVNGTVKKFDLYTIVAEKNNWGKLKTGAGWIDLNNTKKL